LTGVERRNTLTDQASLRRHGLFRLTVLNIPDLDRGVGLAVVMQTPGGGTFLYDTGTGYPEGDGWFADVNTGRDQIAPLMEKYGIKVLDGVIISHAHYDHFGGLIWLAEHVEIRRLIDSGYEFTGWCDEHYARELSHYVEVRESLRRRGVSYRAVCAGDRLELDDALIVEVISPPSGFFGAGRIPPRSARNPAAHYMLNANSLIVRIRHGDLVFLLAGDIETEDQRNLLLPTVGKEKLKCDILIAPGHGLHTAPEFADAARPHIVIASCFARWADACTARQEFAARGSEVFVTGLDGEVTVTSDGEKWRISTSGC